jgi:hypothetical protein
MQVRRLITSGVAALSLALPASASAGHGLEALLHDHPAPPPGPTAPLSSEVNAGGQGAKWELITSVPTGNPHTDVDFFTRGGETYLSAGTLGIGANGGGQTIVQLTQGGELDPQPLNPFPSASCLSNPADVTGLQHDVEATPKGTAPLNTANPFAVTSDAQLIVDATDAPGRCHDQGELGLANAPQGGLEIIDVTNPDAPAVIGMTSHIGEAHTVNIDPKRPHIAYAVTSDSVGVEEDGTRSNESGSGLNLDGFEVVDMSSCMNFPEGTSIAQKRASCKPQVWRYRYPTAQMALGHTLKDTIYACHELEVYPDDRLMCASGAALLGFDMRGAFDDMGTPDDFTDDKPRGTPLPCNARPSSSAPPFFVPDLTVVDCVDGAGGADLTVPGWLAAGAPSLEGVQHIGSIHHQGRAGTGEVAPTDSDEDIDFNHEAELSHSGNLLIATDERGGGILPPGASCASTPGGQSANPQGNGGVHFYRTSGLHGGGPGTPESEYAAYAQTPEGEKAIFRAPIRTQPRATVCTAHVFHQMPGENRIFMGWYSQGTHVIDFVERSDGTVEIKEAGWFLPENNNQWVSAIFDSEKNSDGTVTYYGAAGDFSLGEAGRNTIDIYKVTLPPAPSPAAGPGVGSGPTGGGAGGGGGGGDGVKPAGRNCPNVISGGKQPERLTGTNFGDTIRGNGGRDRIAAGDGDDCVLGGKGKDLLKGQNGNDRISGGKGRDVAAGGSGNDRIKVRGGGKDKARCGAGDDVAITDKRDRARGCEKVREKK